MRKIITDIKYGEHQILFYKVNQWFKSRDMIVDLYFEDEYLVIECRNQTEKALYEMFHMRMNGTFNEQIFGIYK